MQLRSREQADAASSQTVMENSDLPEAPVEVQELDATQKEELAIGPPVEPAYSLPPWASISETQSWLVSEFANLHAAVNTIKEEIDVEDGNVGLHWSKHVVALSVVLASTTHWFGSESDAACCIRQGVKDCLVSLRHYDIDILRPVVDRLDAFMNVEKCFSGQVRSQVQGQSPKAAFTASPRRGQGQGFGIVHEPFNLSKFMYKGNPFEKESAADTLQRSALMTEEPAISPGTPKLKRAGKTVPATPEDLPNYMVPLTRQRQAAPSSSKAYANGGSPEQKSASSPFQASYASTYNSSSNSEKKRSNSNDNNPPVPSYMNPLDKASPKKKKKKPISPTGSMGSVDSGGGGYHDRFIRSKSPTIASASGSHEYSFSGRKRREHSSSPRKRRDSNKFDEKMESRIRSKLKAASYTVDGVNWGKLFHYYDKDKSGHIGFDEFKRLLRTDAKISITALSDHDVRELFDTVDSDGSGEMDLHEFHRFVTGEMGTTSESKMPNRAPQDGVASPIEPVDVEDVAEVSPTTKSSSARRGTYFGTYSSERRPTHSKEEKDGNCNSNSKTSSPKRTWDSSSRTTPLPGGGRKWSIDAVASPERTVSDAIKVGSKVRLKSGKRGTVRYLGKTAFKDGEWAGIELDSTDGGRHDGSVRGVRYFECMNNESRGVFVQPNTLSLVPSPFKVKEGWQRTMSATDKTSRAESSLPQKLTREQVVRIGYKLKSVCFRTTTDTDTFVPVLPWLKEDSGVKTLARKVVKKYLRQGGVTKRLVTDGEMVGLFSFLSQYPSALPETVAPGHVEVKKLRDLLAGSLELIEEQVLELHSRGSSTDFRVDRAYTIYDRTNNRPIKSEESLGLAGSPKSRRGGFDLDAFKRSKPLHRRVKSSPGRTISPKPTSSSSVNIHNDQQLLVAIKDGLEFVWEMQGSRRAEYKKQMVRPKSKKNISSNGIDKKKNAARSPRIEPAGRTRTKPSKIQRPTGDATGTKHGKDVKLQNSLPVKKGGVTPKSSGNTLPAQKIHHSRGETEQLWETAVAFKKVASNETDTPLPPRVEEKRVEEKQSSVPTSRSTEAAAKPMKPRRPAPSPSESSMPKTLSMGVTSSSKTLVPALVERILGPPPSPL